jgi:heme/copper-type cytochrome/quinol oxidase subunit 4
MNGAGAHGQGQGRDTLRYLTAFATMVTITTFELVVIQLPVERAARITALAGLAMTKGAVVLLYFMNLRGESRGLRLTVLAPLLLAPLFAVVLMLEAAFRARLG